MMLPTKQSSILKFSNDQKVERKKLNVRAFYLFHKCQFQCYKTNPTQEVDMCLQYCVQDLNAWQNYKKTSKPEELKVPVFSFPEENRSQPDGEEKYHNYKRGCIEIEIRGQDYNRTLREYLDKWDSRVSAPTKKQD
eukprot:TRINITY_DN2042_c0_g1_i5.p2 TRINITY_DN2042_c0_g1~~TRINITY_DN2042_c0_g1_i5.p2  ORF type:complete len:136 (-),score=22.28 TRINITY_DN2042_c0_g1_i5:294-701(-)